VQVLNVKSVPQQNVTVVTSPPDVVTPLIVAVVEVTDVAAATTAVGGPVVVNVSTAEYTYTVDPPTVDVTTNCT
jgi:hypothetical protein